MGILWFRVVWLAENTLILGAGDGIKIEYYNTVNGSFNLNNSPFAGIVPGGPHIVFFEGEVSKIGNCPGVDNAVGLTLCAGGNVCTPFIQLVWSSGYSGIGLYIRGGYSGGPSYWMAWKALS